MIMTTSKTTRRTVAFIPGIVGCLMLSLVSGCGLAMSNEDRLDRGEEAFANGDFRAAIIDAKDVLLDEPDNLRGRLLLGRASVEVGDGPSAEKELLRAMQLGVKQEDVAAGMARALLLQRKYEQVLNDIPIEGLPSVEVEAKVLVARAGAYMGLNQPELAREVYSSVLELQPDNLDSRLGIVSSFAAEGNFVQARGALDQVLDTYGDNPRVWLYSGSLNLRAGNFEAATANFKAALDLATSQGDDTARMQARAGLAESLFEQQDIESAREQIDSLAAEAPQSLQSKLLTARIAYYDEDWATAEQNLQQVLRVAPNYRPAQLLLGTVHLRSGNLSQAEMYLSAAVASVPNDVRARQLLAETRLQAQKAEEALEALSPILSQSDADAMSLQMAARASLGGQNVDEAIAYLRRSAAENPGNLDLQFQLAAMLLQAGRHSEAQEVLDASDVSGSEEDAFRRDGLKVLTAISDGQIAAALDAATEVADTYSDRFGAFMLLGVAQLANKDMAAASTSFERASELQPTNVLARHYLAAIDVQVGELGSAATRYKQILADTPDAAWAMFGLGRIAVRQEDFELAAQYFRSATEAAPENVDYRLGLAKVERQLGNKQIAQDMLEDSMEATLGNFPSAVMLGALRAESGDLDGALEIADQLEKRFPDNPASFAFEAEVHVIGGNLADADAAYAKALSLGPTRNHAVRASAIKRELGVAGAQQPLIDYLEVRPLDNVVRFMLAEYYMQSGNLGESAAEYEQILTYEPENAVVLNNLAWNYWLVGDSRAVETAQKAYAAAPENGSIVDTLGWILVQQGSVEEGESLLRQAVELTNGQAEIRYHHAAALAKLGRVDEARRTLDEILAGDEDFSGRKDAESLLAEL